MNSYSKRVTRLVKSYAPIRNALTEILGIDKVQQQPLMVYCSYKKQYLPADEFYTKKYRQEIDSRTFSNQDFRHISKEIWDQKVKNQRKGLGWKTDQEVLDGERTLETFFDEAI